MQVLYEDNHIIIVSKTTGEIVQGDKTGDKPLSETVKQYIKEAYAKPGDVLCSDSSCLHVLRRHCQDSMPCLQTVK